LSQLNTVLFSKLGLKNLVIDNSEHVNSVWVKIIFVIMYRKFGQYF